MGVTTIAEDPNIQNGALDRTLDISAYVDKIFHQLSHDEKEKAARASSYRYLVASSSTSPATQDLDQQQLQRNQHVKVMIERYVIVQQKLYKSKSPDAWEEAACANLRKTLEYREEKQVDAILQCFDEDKQLEEDGVHATIRQRLEDMFSDKIAVVRGYTMDGSAMSQNFPRNMDRFEIEYFIKQNIYLLERALACTERHTNGEKDKIVIFYDYNGYAMKNSPPPLFVKELLSDFRDHWPERLRHVFIVDSPFFFRAFWAIVKHFIDPITKELVQFITGEEQKKILREIVSEDQAAPYMFDGGKDGEETDIKAFLYETPFDHVYGEHLSWNLWKLTWSYGDGVTLNYFVESESFMPHMTEYIW